MNVYTATILVIALLFVALAAYCMCVVSGMCSDAERIVKKTFSDSETDMSLVYHPAHYNSDGRKECWDEMEDIYGPEAVAIFDCLSAYKYYYRIGLKPGNTAEQDAEKIKNYIDHAEKKASGNYRYSLFVLSKTKEIMRD